MRNFSVEEYHGKARIVLINLKLFLSSLLILVVIPFRAERIEDKVFRLSFDQGSGVFESWKYFRSLLNSPKSPYK